MKPRLEALPLTDSDEGIWADVIDRTARDTALGNGLSNMFCVSEDSDRRDADRMYRIAQARASGHWDASWRILMCACWWAKDWLPR